MKQAISLEEVLAILTDLARNGEGAQKLGALRMLSAMKSGEPSLPAPLTREERNQRLALIMRWAGADTVEEARRLAFHSGDTRHLTQAMERQAQEATEPPPIHLPGEVGEKIPTTVKQMRKRFPRLPRIGNLPGYPVKGTEEERAAWCRAESLNLIRLERREAALETKPYDVDQLLER